MDARMPDEDTIVSYLLGELPEDARAAFEDRAFMDEQLSREVRAVEHDLIDEYVRGGLTETRRAHFEQLFLASAKRRQDVAFARALAQVSDEAGPADLPARSGWWQTSLAVLRHLTMSPQVGFATAIVLAVGASWLVLDRGQLRSELARVQADRQDQRSQADALRQQLSDEAARRIDLSAQLEAERRRAEALAGQSSAGANTPSAPLLALFLPPGLSRSATTRPSLALPPPALPPVTLQIGLETEDQFPRFAIELRAADGRLVLSRTGLGAETSRAGRVLALTVPAGTMTAGQYELRLQGVGTGPAEDLRYYYFDVQTR
jgi:hypothetical protein